MSLWTARQLMYIAMETGTATHKYPLATYSATATGLSVNPRRSLKEPFRFCSYDEWWTLSLRLPSTVISHILPVWASLHLMLSSFTPSRSLGQRWRWHSALTLSLSCNDSTYICHTEYVKVARVNTNRSCMMYRRMISSFNGRCPVPRWIFCRLNRVGVPGRRIPRLLLLDH